MHQDLLKERQRAWVVRLPQPEHRLLADLAIVVGLRHFDQFGHALVFWQLTQRENSFFLNVGVRIVFDSPGNRAHRFLPGLVRQPE